MSRATMIQNYARRLLRHARELGIEPAFVLHEGDEDLRENLGEMSEDAKVKEITACDLEVLEFPREAHQRGAPRMMLVWPNIESGGVVADYSAINSLDVLAEWLEDIYQ